MNSDVGVVVADMVVVTREVVSSVVGPPVVDCSVVGSSVVMIGTGVDCSVVGPSVVDCSVVGPSVVMIGTGVDCCVVGPSVIEGIVVGMEVDCWHSGVLQGSVVGTGVDCFVVGAADVGAEIFVGIEVEGSVDSPFVVDISSSVVVGYVLASVVVELLHGSSFVNRLFGKINFTIPLKNAFTETATVSVSSEKNVIL